MAAIQSGLGKHRIGAARFLIAGACLLLASAAGAQERGYMRVLTTRGQIAGDSTDPAHNGWILFRYANMPSATEIEGMSQEASASSGAGATDAKPADTARKSRASQASGPSLVHRPVVIVKEQDRTSMPLMIAMTTHQVLPQVDIVLTSKNNETTATYKLTNASVISIRTGDTNGGTDAPLEQLRLNYEKIEIVK